MNKYRPLISADIRPEFRRAMVERLARGNWYGEPAPDFYFGHWVLAWSVNYSERRYAINVMRYYLKGLCL